MEKKKRLYILAFLAVFAVIAIIAVYVGRNGVDEPIYTSYNEFLRMAESGYVAGVTLGDYPRFTFIDNYGKIWETDNPRNPLFKENLLIMGISVEEARAAGDALNAAVTLIFFVAVIFLIVRIISRNGGGKVMAMDVKDADEAGQGGVRFDDIAGNEEAKDSVADIIDFIKEPEKFARYGARMPRGMIFHGPPGTGKTLMAKAIAGEAGVKFFAVSGSDFVQMYVGVGASRVRALFKKAREAGRAVIFIDEIDALAKKRSAVSTGGSDERDQTLNALLTEMSGFTANDGIVVIAATNRLDTLDEAILRPGRFDRHVEISLPDLQSRERILRLHCKNKPLSGAIDIQSLAKQTVYFSGAMLENLMNEAAIAAARKGQGNIEREDMDEAYYSIIAGKAKKDRSQIRENERRVTAFHEAGHALAAKLRSPENTVAKVTIIPSTRGAGGFCLNIPPDKLFFTKAELEAQIIVSLAGRAAEELVCGHENITTGASSDISQAAKLAHDFVSKYGMGRAGFAPLSEDDCRKEQAGLLDRLYEEAKSLLSENTDALRRVANALLLKETISEAELEGLVEGRYQ